MTTWDQWLSNVMEQGYGSAGDLVEALGQAGIPDNVARAERMLKQAEEAGTIVRGANPDIGNRWVRQLIYFGVGGLEGGQATIAGRSPVLYG